MTDAPPAERVLSLITAILRRSAHEIRNSLNGVAVNVEVVRSRSSRPGGSGEVSAFAERAVSEVATASALMDGTLALAQEFLGAMAEGKVRAGADAGGNEGSFSITGAGPRLEGLRAAIATLAPRIGVTVETNGQAVIFTVLPESSSLPKA